MCPNEKLMELKTEMSKTNFLFFSFYVLFFKQFFYSVIYAKYINVKCFSWNLIFLLTLNKKIKAYLMNDKLVIMVSNYKTAENINYQIYRLDSFR